MKLVKAEFIRNVQKDQEAGCDTNRQADNVNEGVDLLADHYTKRDSEVVEEHAGLFSEMTYLLARSLHEEAVIISFLRFRSLARMSAGNEILEMSQKRNHYKYGRYQEPDPRTGHRKNAGNCNRCAHLSLRNGVGQKAAQPQTNGYPGG